MNDAVNRFLDEMGERYAADGNRDISPILFKADDGNGGMVFELSLPKGEPHPYWRVREREMIPDEVAALMQTKKERGDIPWTIGSIIISGLCYRVRGFVYNARLPNKWNLSVDGAK